MGSLRGWLLLAVCAAASAAAAAQEGGQLQQRDKRDASGVEEEEAEVEAAPALGMGSITAEDIRAAWEAWQKLRDRPKSHTARRRSANEPEESADPGEPKETDEAEDPAAAKKAAAGAADRKRVRVAEFTLTAESSFTAVSRALDHLANRSRSGGGGRGVPIAATEFVVEGTVDADTIQSYLRSHAARGSLAKAEAEALRRVVGALLQAPARARKAPQASKASTAAPRRRRLVERAAPRPFPPQRGR